MTVIGLTELSLLTGLLKLIENNNLKQDIGKLLQIIKKLRSENGCPWDKKQTPETIWKCLAEEVYELLDAISYGSPAHICEETGDVLFQLLFIAELYSEKGYFDIDQLITKSSEKMIRRHPHIYKGLIIKNEYELKQMWETIKKQETTKEEKKKQNKSIFDSIPSNMPALLRSYKISERAANSGFDWDDITQVFKKVKEEWEEFLNALAKKNKKEMAMEFGDILFTMVNVARFADIHPETALATATGKFEKRYRYMEKKFTKKGDNLNNLSQNEINILWEDAKKALKKNISGEDI